MLKRLANIAVRTSYYFLIIKLRAFLEAILRAPNQSLIVLCYHGVKAEERSAFGRQMDLLLRLASPVSLGSPTSATTGKSLVALTFDDGYANFVQNALPDLKARGIPVTLFVPSGNLGRPPGWHMRDNWPDRNERLLTAEELQALKCPLVTIGSHSVAHADLTKLPTEQVLWELCGSKQELEMILGSPVELFAFPYGRYTESIAGLSRKVGYRKAFTLEPEISSPDSDHFLVGRFLVNPRDWRIEFWLKVRGTYALSAPLHRLTKRL